MFLRKAFNKVKSYFAKSDTRKKEVTKINKEVTKTNNRVKNNFASDGKHQIGGCREQNTQAIFIPSKSMQIKNKVRRLHMAI